MADDISALTNDQLGAQAWECISALVRRNNLLESKIAKANADRESAVRMLAIESDSFWEYDNPLSGDDDE